MDNEKATGAVTSRATASVPLESTTTLADLRDLLAEAERLGAPDDAKVSVSKALGGLVSALVIGWKPEPTSHPGDGGIQWTLPISGSSADYAEAMRAAVRRMAAVTDTPTRLAWVASVRPGHMNCHRDERGRPYAVCCGDL